MNCSKLIDYINGHLSDDEQKSFERHLETCAECKEGYKEMTELMGGLPYLSEPVTPPSGMKDRVLNHVLNETENETNDDTSEQKQSSEMKVVKNKPQENKETSNNEPPKRQKRWPMRLMAACLVISLIGNGYAMSNGWFTDEGEQTNSAPMVISDVTLTPAKEVKMNGNAYLVKENKHLYLVVKADNMKPTTEGKVYQVWLINDGKPYPAGVFEPDKGGTGEMNHKILKQNHSWDAVAISLESAPNHEKPKGPILATSNF